jgi:hypothetical protein
MKILLLSISAISILALFILYPSVNAGADRAAKYNQPSITIPAGVQGDVVVDAIVMAKGASYARAVFVLCEVQSLIAIIAALCWRRTNHQGVEQEELVEANR